MKWHPQDPPRRFTVGTHGGITISHCADITLEADELVTFQTESGGAYDVTRKDWGYYATPSINARLLDQGFRTALVENPQRRRYVMLVERTQEDAFRRYLADESQEIVAWLDDDEAVGRLGQGACPFCGNPMRPVARYDAPPEGENRFPIPQEAYARELRQCGVCRHVVNVHTMDLSALYDAVYVDTAYTEGLKGHFDTILSLPPERSDNEGRVARVVQFMTGRDLEQPLRVLDVGSGLCVFLHRLKAVTGWTCTALDTDARQVAHARGVAGVEALQGSFESADNLGRYGLITFNKVLEHVPDPVAMLARSRAHLTPRGVVYVEVPDAEAALTAGPDREEFFVEHYHAFSAASMALFASLSGLVLDTMERLREPSGKYTIRAFMRA